MNYNYSEDYVLFVIQFMSVLCIILLIAGCIIGYWFAKRGSIKKPVLKEYPRLMDRLVDQGPDFNSKAYVAIVIPQKDATYKRLLLEGILTYGTGPGGITSKEVYMHPDKARSFCEYLKAALVDA